MTTPSQNPSGTQASGAASQSGTNGGNLKESASQLAEQAKSEGKRHVETARQTTADSVEKLARSAKAAASELQQDDVGHLSQYLSNMADGMTRLASRMRDKSGEELVQEFGRIARENPALFVTGSVALGFGLARFARATAPGARSSGDLATGSQAGSGFDQSGSNAYAGAGLGTSGMDATGSPGMGASSSSGASGAGYVSTGPDAAASGLGSDRASTGSNTGAASGARGEPDLGTGSTGSLDAGSDLTRSSGSSDAAGVTGSPGVNTAGTAGTIGSGTTGLNNYSPGSNLASGAGSQAGQDASTADGDRSPTGNRGGLNS
jgi:vacuolar-type H+-ATPase subunit H